MANTLIDGDAHREGDTSQNDLSGLVLVLVDGIGALSNQLISELADIHNSSTGNALT